VTANILLSHKLIICTAFNIWI